MLRKRNALAGLGILLPVHTLSKVELKGDLLELSPLSYDWLAKAIKDHKIGTSNLEKATQATPEGAGINLPFKKIDGHYVFTASAAEWRKFLDKYADAPGVFPRQEDGAIHFKFKKVIEEDKKAGKTSPLGSKKF